MNTLTTHDKWLRISTHFPRIELTPEHPGAVAALVQQHLTKVEAIKYAWELSKMAAGYSDNAMCFDMQLEDLALVLTASPEVQLDALGVALNLWKPSQL